MSWNGVWKFYFAFMGSYSLAYARKDPDDAMGDIIYSVICFAILLLTIIGEVEERKRS